MFGIRADGAFDGERVVPGGTLVLAGGGRIAGVEPGMALAPEGCQVLEAPGADCPLREHVTTGLLPQDWRSSPGGHSLLPLTTFHWVPGGR
jgi:hypothetical protein